MKNIFALKAMKLMCMPLLCLVFIISCSKNDEFKEFTDGKEIKYPGKIDSVRFNPGKERVQFQGILNSDPSIVKYRIFWNDGKDSIEYNIESAPDSMIVENIFAVEEGTRSFTIFTYDEFGNTSVPVTAVGTSYGDAYRRKLNNRLMGFLDFDSTATTINWEPMDLSTGAQYTEIVYPLNSGEQDTIRTLAAESGTVLEGLTTSSTIKYRTIFKPKESSIDTFSVPFTDYFVRVVPQLKNRKVPFIASEISATNARWGNLADWESNEAIKNHDGYGGWDSWNDNIFNIETGFGGAPGINNGKIYQTFTLDPGSYTFEISDLKNTNLEPTDLAYLVAAVGDGLPDVESVEEAAIGYVKIYDRPVSELKVIFTITETTVVSLGFLTTQPGPPTNRFCNIRAFDFYFNEEEE